MSGQNQEQHYMLLGDTYADIMYAMQLLEDREDGGNDTFETVLAARQIQLEDIFENISDYDPDVLGEAVEAVSEQVLTIITELEHLR